MLGTSGCALISSAAGGTDLAWRRRGRRPTLKRQDPRCAAQARTRRHMPSKFCQLTQLSPTARSRVHARCALVLPKYSEQVPDADNLLACSFCRMSQRQVKKLIAGPG